MLLLVCLSETRTVLEDMVHHQLARRESSNYKRPYAWNLLEGNIKRILT